MEYQEYGGQVSYTFLLRITCKKGGGGTSRKYTRPSSRRRRHGDDGRCRDDGRVAVICSDLQAQLGLTVNGDFTSSIWSWFSINKGVYFSNPWIIMEIFDEN